MFLFLLSKKSLLKDSWFTLLLTVLISAVQLVTQLHTYKHIFIFFSIMVYHRMVPCAMQQDLAVDPSHI